MAGAGGKFPEGGEQAEGRCEDQTAGRQAEAHNATW